MRKLITLILFIICSCCHINGQIQKGNTAIGGDMSLNFDLDNNGDVSFFLNPMWGKFVTDRLLLSGQLGFAVFSGNIANRWSLSIGPSMRYYAAINENVSPFFTAGGSFGYQDFTGGSQTIHSLFAGFGASIHVNEHVTIDGRLIYRHVGSKFFGASNSINLLGGFSVYLERKETD